MSSPWLQLSSFTVENSSLILPHVESSSSVRSDPDDIDARMIGSSSDSNDRSNGESLLLHSDRESSIFADCCPGKTE